jgi:glycosyltransferase involved in cell wall biosynthesis
VFVISTPVGVASDLIQHGGNGLITRDISSESIRISLEEFINNRTTIREKMFNLRHLDNSVSKLTFEGYVNRLNQVIKDYA